MSARFEELDWRQTPMGAISLRRRRDPLSGVDVHEVKLDDDYLMSSLFTVAEIAVARLALDKLAADSLDVAVGGLGLGFTAQAVLADTRVSSLIVVEAIPEIVEWHERGLIPLGQELTADPRCRFVLGDFFAMVESGELDPQRPSQRYDAVVVDIDHSPRHLLHPRHAGFYQPSGVRRMASLLEPTGVFTLWSNDPPDDAYLKVLGSVFSDVSSEVVRFANPLQEREATNTVYVASAADVRTQRSASGPASMTEM